MKRALNFFRVCLVAGLVFHFSAASTKIFLLMMMILPMLMICYRFLGVTYASDIPKYLLVELKMFVIVSEWM